MDVSLGATRRHSVTSRPETARAVEPALAAIRLEISIPKIDGVSEYPVPYIQSQMGTDYA
jgi:hypothetical protein